MSALDGLRSQAVPVEVLHVDNIAAADVRQFLSDTLKPAVDDVEGLAAIIHGQTMGNPFFVRSFFDFLFESNRIWFDLLRNGWRWRAELMRGSDLPGHVVELFVLKLRRLDRDSQELFSLAACLGNRFDLGTLSLISGRDQGECMARLFADQARSLLLPLDDGGRHETAAEQRVPKVFAFLHDRVQQAAYSLIEPAQLPIILLRIGRLLLASLPPEALAERLYEIAGDLNAGRHLMTETAERVNALELNLAAARKAYAETAYRSALQYFRAADGFLEIPGLAELLWRERHETIMQLFKERAECEFLEGNYASAERGLQQAVIRADTAMEKASALTILIVHYTLLARYPEAIAAGRQALAALNINLPEEGYEAARDEEIAAFRKELGCRPISSLFELPVMIQPEMLLASKILITMGPPCYRSHQKLWSVIVPKVVNLTLHFGNIPQVGYSHTAFGGLLGWVDDDYAAARELGELATRLMTDTFPTPSDQSVFYLMIGSSIRHWFQHLRQGTRDYSEAYDIGLRAGNLQYAAYAFGHNMYCRFYQGVPLTALIRESQYSLEFSRVRRNQWASDLLEGGLWIFALLSEPSPAPDEPAPWSEGDFLQRVEDNHNIQVACIFKVLKAFACLVLGRHDQALKISDEVEPLIYTVGTQGLLPWPEHVSARLLNLTALYAKADDEKQRQWRAEMAPMMRRLRIWAENGPENFEPPYRLAAAELARIDGRPEEAMRLYDQAVASAQAGGFLQWEGLANERASGFWQGYGNERLAHVYWQQAYVCYDRWGARAKVRAMEEDYRLVLAYHLPGGDGGGLSGESRGAEPAKALLENQIARLRLHAAQMQQAKLGLETATQVEELARATERLRVEIAERKRTEEALRESEERFHSLFDNMGEGVALHELVFKDGRPVDYRIIDVNNRFTKILGVSREQVIGKLAAEAYGTSTPPYLDEYVEVGIGRKIAYFETYFASMDKHFAISVAPWQKSGFATIFSDITERRLAQEEIKRQLSEKETLLKEVHHRIKNNIASIGGLLTMHLRSVADPEAAAALRDAIGRVDSMRILYDTLLLGEGYTDLSVKTYVEKLADTIVAMFPDRASLTLVKRLDDFPLEPRRLFPLGIIINELLTNAMKYAFTGRESGTLEVALTVADGRAGLIVQDDGPGLPSGFEVQDSKGFGLTLVRMLCQQLGGVLKFENRGGARFRVEFPL